MAYVTSQVVGFQIWNQLDEFGLILDTPRIPGESPETYKTRLLDVMVHRAGPQAESLAYGLTRDLGLTQHDGALVITQTARADGQPVSRDLGISVRSDGVVVHAQELYINSEVHIVPLITRRILLAETLSDRTPLVESPKGTSLGRDDFEIDWDRNELILSVPYKESTVYVSYEYIEVVTLSQTMTQLQSAISALTLPSGELFVIATLSSSMTGSETAKGMILLSHQFVDQIHTTPAGDYHSEYRLPWSEAYVMSLGDKNVVDANLSPEGTYFGTPLERWVEQASTVAHVNWGNTVFDRDRWSSNLGLAVVPTLLDATVGSWKCSDPSHSLKMSPEHAVSHDMRCPIDNYPLQLSGIGARDMNSGIGYGTDLKVIVSPSELESPSPTIYEVASVITGVLSIPVDDLDSLEAAETV